MTLTSYPSPLQAHAADTAALLARLRAFASVLSLAEEGEAGVITLHGMAGQHSCSVALTAADLDQLLAACASPAVTDETP